MFLLLGLAIAFLLGLGSAAPARSSPKERRDNSTALLAYSLPSGPQPLRAAAIKTKQETFLYGPAVGAGPFYPAGALGTTYNAADIAIETTELGAEAVVGAADLAEASVDAAKYNGLQTLDDYVKLYDDEWVEASQPTGQAPGILTNYTQDLLFSMERLSFSPYAVRRLLPDSDTPAFAVSDTIVQNLTGLTLDGLFQSGRLFYADHRNQSTLPHNPGKYAAACDAYFYISPSSGDFLPLAIRTNFGNDLIYTPADDANDWLVAKMMFNVNDFFMNQFDHFARNHFTLEIVYMAAVRTLSDDHPVLAILRRLAYAAFSIRPLALVVLLRPGGTFDEYFGYGGAAAAEFANNTYFNGFSGAIQANYFERNLESRNLINSPIGPALKSFPFYSDSLPLYTAIKNFTTTFVSSYYTSSSSLASDNELQSWLIEASGPAGVIDFPTATTLTQPADLALLLAELARSVSISHHTQNLNQLITSASTLPFHPTAFFQPLPETKGNITNPAFYLPDLNSSLGTINIASDFSRPLLAGTNRSLVHMFDDEVMLARMNSDVRAANEIFMGVMEERSEVVSSRNFGSDGLSQGMPFVWKALDPGVIPWSLTI